MHPFFSNDLIQLHFFWYDLINQVFILRKNCTCIFLVVFMFTSTRLLILMNKTYHKTPYKCLPDDETWLYRNVLNITELNH